MKKRILAVILCVLMIVTMLPTWALAEEVQEQAAPEEAVTEVRKAESAAVEEPEPVIQETNVEAEETSTEIEETSEIPETTEEELSTEPAVEESAPAEPETAEAEEKTEPADEVDDGSENEPAETEGEEAAQDETATDSENEEELGVQNVDEAAEDEKVRVTFELDPPDAMLTVYTLDENEEKQIIEPEEDGTYLLLPGEYYYDAECDNYLTKEHEVFVITDIDNTLEVSLTPAEDEASISAMGTHTVVMTASEFIGYLQYVVDRKDSKYGSGDQYSIGKYENGKIYFDCNGLGESIIATKGKIVYNTDPSLNPWNLWDYSCGIKSGGDSWFESVCIGKSSDFSNLVPGEWLIKRPNPNYWHFGYYIGNGKVIEATTSGNNMVQISTIDSNGHDSLQGVNWTWDYHAKAPWIDYSGASSGGTTNYLSKCTSYPAFGKVTISKACNPFTLPCNSTTASRYNSTSTELTSKALKAGSKITVTGIVYNTENHYWYKADLDNNGSTYYVYAANADVSSYTHLSPWVYNSTFPDKITGTQELSGAILSGGSQLVSIQGMVLNGDTTDTSKRSNVYNSSPISCSGTTYWLKGTAVDNGLVFGNLSAGQYYTLVYLVKVKHYKLTSTTSISSEQTETYTVKDKCFYRAASESTVLYYLDLNGYLDGTETTHIAQYGTVDVYIKGSLDASGVDDYYKGWPAGTKYEIRNIQPKTGRKYNGEHSGSVSGTINSEFVRVSLSFSTETYTVSFNANGGSGAPGSQTKTYGKVLTLSSTKPTRSGYVFAGWATSSTATSPEYSAGGSFNVDANTTLYAVWSKTYTVTYDLNDGRGIWKTTTKNTGETVQLSSTEPSRDCHVFKGWATTPAAASAQYQPGDSYSADANLTLYAVWAEGEYSEWSETRPESIEESQIETKTQYRYSSKETTQSTDSSLSGWTLLSSELRWSDYGNWTSWSPDSVTANDSRQVETRTAYGWYYYECPKCHAHMHGYGTCWDWCGGCGATKISSIWHEMYDGTNWSVAKDWHGTGKYYATINGETWFKWEDNGQPRTEYRYRTRSQYTYYTYYRWTDWSEWSDTVYTANDDRQVETRTLYRYLLEGDNAHAWDEGTITKPATCTEDGMVLYTCTRCGKTREATLAKAEHQYTDTLISPTCTERGYTLHFCYRCGDSYMDNYVDALGHSWGEWTVTKAATCTEKGTETRTCTHDSNHKETKEIAALGHNYVNGVCTRVGCGERDPNYAVDTTGKLIVSAAKGRMGDEVTVNVSIAENPGIMVLNLGFDYDRTRLSYVGFEDAGFTDWTVASNAVWLGNSNSSFNGVILKLKFKILDNAPEGDAYVTVTCGDGDMADQNETVYVPSIQAGKVTVFITLPGDINGDGKVNALDLVRLKRVIAGENVELVGSGDTTGDGKVNALDLVRLKRAIAGENVELH